MTLSVIIPVFNEENYIKNVIDNLSQLSYVDEIIIIDDGSTDQTKEILSKVKSQKIKILFNEENKGKGYSLIKGIKNCNTDYLIFFDSDFEYNHFEIENFLKLLKKKGHIDCIIGNRFQSYFERKIGYFYHTVFNKFITCLFNLLNNSNLNDLECCLKFFNTKKLQSLNLKEKKFGIEVEVMSKAIKNKLNIYEVGVSYNARSYDEGKKIKFIDALDAIICVFKYKFL